MSTGNTSAPMVVTGTIDQSARPGASAGTAEPDVYKERVAGREAGSRKRDTDQDGKRLEVLFLTRLPLFWRIVQAVPTWKRAMNFWLINRAINKAPTRPSPFSTKADYTSWPAVVDRTWFSRHLPPDPAARDPKDPELPKLAKSLFCRRANDFRASPKSTALFSHFAQWFTDGFLRAERDPKTFEPTLKNTSNHEIDLSTLYGLNEEQTDALREHKDGLLKSQKIGRDGGEFPPFYYDFREDASVDIPQEHWKNYKAKGFERLPEPFVPPFNPITRDQRNRLFAMGVERANATAGFVMMNVLFLREHNRIARELKRNVKERWKDDDERLFQTARNILTVLLLKIVIEDYINHITPYHFQFELVKGRRIDKAWYRTNWVSLEFTLLYRWHCLVPDCMLIGSATRVDMEKTLFNNQLLTDHGLRDAFVGASRQPAGRIGLLNTRQDLLRTEEASLRLGRQARLATYNAYRERFGFPGVTRFEQISSDPEICRRLRDAYRDRVNDIELYVGLFAEDLRPNSVLAPLMGRMVGIDALSQALTNPLLAERIWGEKTFSCEGMKIIKNTHSLRDIVERNVGDEAERGVSREAVSEVSFTNAGWQRQ